MIYSRRFWANQAGDCARTQRAQPFPTSRTSNAVESLCTVPWGNVESRWGCKSAMREGGMGNVKRFLAAITVALFFASVAAADTLELKSGKVMQGRYLGGTAA